MTISMQTNGLSIDAKNRVDTMLARADAIFDYEWLFQLLWDEFRKHIAKQRLNEFCDTLQQEKERRFLWAFVESHRSSLGEIKDIQHGMFEDEDLGLLLFEERTRLIEEFALMHLSTRWAHIYRQQDARKPNDSWRRFVMNLNFDDEREVEQIKRFLYLLDKICLITDILTSRDTDSGVGEVSLVKYRRTRLNLNAPPSNEPPREKLIKAIKTCEPLFKFQTAWAVVRVLCIEDFGAQMNKSVFERYAQSLLREPELADFSQGCPNGTIQSAETGKNGSGKFFQLHSSQWPVNGGYPWAIDLMAKLRQAIDILSIEERAAEQKKLYKLSEKGF